MHADLNLWGLILIIVKFGLESKLNCISLASWKKVFNEYSVSIFSNQIFATMECLLQIRL